jgi:2'-phosphotransferase
MRHKAAELGCPISADGWVALPDAIDHVNRSRLRDIVGNAAALAGRTFTEADVREVVRDDNKQRFELREADGGTQIRNAQGHTMPIEGVGTPLTLMTAPAVAVHGSYAEHLQPILAGGLSKMGRNHIHLAKGLLGEADVISGMRGNCELFIWVDVREAIRSGYNVVESTNGVILCDGRDGDGVLPPKFFSVVIELCGGLTLHPAQVRLLERLFAGCSRVAVTKLHGGFSGSLVRPVDLRVPFGLSSVALLSHVCRCCGRKASTWPVAATTRQ